MAAEKGNEMLSSFKSSSKGPDKEVDAAASAPKVADMPTTPPRPVIAPAAATAEQFAKAGTISAIGSGMSIVGTIECNGPAQIFGRVEGELKASDLLIGEGAQVQGNVVAQDVTVCGRVKGTIRAVRVKLEAGGVVEGDIFHKTLSIEETALFEGSSRRVDNPMETPLGAEPKGLPKAIPAAIASIATDLQRR